MPRNTGIDVRRDLFARCVPSFTGELEGNVRIDAQRKELLGPSMHILEASQPFPIGLHPKVEALLVVPLVRPVPWLDGADDDFAQAHDWGTGGVRIDGTLKTHPKQFAPRPCARNDRLRLSQTPNC